MSYWGPEADDCDYAMTSIGAYVFLIKERMFLDAKNVIEKQFPEQSIIASVAILRNIGREFPESVKIHFGKKEIKKAQEMFEEWYNLVDNKIPKKYKDELLQVAKKEFTLFLKELFNA